MVPSSIVLPGIFQRHQMVSTALNLPLVLKAQDLWFRVLESSNKHCRFEFACRTRVDVTSKTSLPEAVHLPAIVCDPEIKSRQPDAANVARHANSENHFAQLAPTRLSRSAPSRCARAASQLLILLAVGRRRSSSIRLYTLLWDPRLDGDGTDDLPRRLKTDTSDEWASERQRNPSLRRFGPPCFGAFPIPPCAILRQNLGGATRITPTKTTPTGNATVTTPMCSTPMLQPALSILPGLPWSPFTSRAGRANSNHSLRQIRRRRCIGLGLGLLLWFGVPAN